jgi:cytochrome c oxidase assembly factor CtaG
MWAWHAPALFDRTLQSQPWHVAQHLSFVLSSLLFWVAMLDPRRGGYFLSPPAWSSPRWSRARSAR